MCRSNLRDQSGGSHGCRGHQSGFIDFFHGLYPPSTLWIFVSVVTKQQIVAVRQKCSRLLLLQQRLYAITPQLKRTLIPNTNSWDGAFRRHPNPPRAVGHPTGTDLHFALTHYCSCKNRQKSRSSGYNAPFAAPATATNFAVPSALSGSAANPGVWASFALGRRPRKTFLQ